MSEFKDVLKMIETEIDDVLFGDEKVKPEGEYLSSKSDYLAMPEVHAKKKFKEKTAEIREKEVELAVRTDNIELVAEKRRVVEKNGNSKHVTKEWQVVEKTKEKEKSIKKDIEYDMLAMPEVHWKKKKK